MQPDRVNPRPPHPTNRRTVHQVSRPRPRRGRPQPILRSLRIVHHPLNRIVPRQGSLTVVPSRIVRRRRQRIIGPIRRSPFARSRIVPHRPRPRRAIVPHPLVQRNHSPSQSGTNLLPVSKHLRPSGRRDIRPLRKPRNPRRPCTSNRNRRRPRRKSVKRSGRSLQEGSGKVAHVEWKLFRHPEFFSGCFFSCNSTIEIAARFRRVNKLRPSRAFQPMLRGGLKVTQTHGCRT